MKKVDSIRFRMYHTGSVGDCLLLLFYKGKDLTFSMLIDCGGWLAKADDIRACVQDIRKTVNGKLDLLVVTHQHMDHISGFNQAKAIFDTITVKQVWMSWIENEEDEIAKRLKELYGKKLKELKETTRKAIANIQSQSREVKHMKRRKISGVNDRFDKKLETMEDTMALIQFEEGIMSLTGAAAKATNNDAMKYVKGKTSNIHYCLPGEVISNMEGAEGMKFFILGPPRDRDMAFFKIDMREEEMYHLAINKKATDEDSVEQEEQIVETGILLQDHQSPFGAQYHQTGSPKFQTESEEKDYAWRGIETDWLETASSIALRVTNLTNNTSLAMAIEFEESERVILLPADAQSGNWMSWHKPDVMKELKKNGNKDTVELLKNTIFYKVGHHGSHNGTASLSGLDHVQSRHLVAFMPLVQDKVPREWGGAKNFPAKKLYNKLIDKTRGRVIRTDEGLATDPRAVNERKKLSKSEQRELNKSFIQDSCFVEYTIQGKERK